VRHFSAISFCTKKLNGINDGGAYSRLFELVRAYSGGFFAIFSYFYAFVLIFRS
jgi:hypothetical protein